MKIYYEIGIIGIGNMGKAILSGIANNKTIPANQIAIYDIDQKRASQVSSELKVVCLSLSELVKKSKNIIIAVKPQDVHGLFKEINPNIEDRKLFISVAAGIKIEQVQKALKNSPIVRCMPNTPALVQKGITAISPSKNCNEEEIEFAKNIFASIGEVLVIRETYMDAVTAISGSGPAYFFEFTRLLAKSGEDLGLNPDIARSLAEKTFTGSAALFEKYNKSLDELRNMVTSKGGTTEAALASFNKDNFEGIIKKAVNYACKRASELSSD